MRRTSLGSLTMIVITVTTLGILLLLALASRRTYLPPISPLQWLAILVLAGITFRMGWAVRAYLNGDKPDLDPLKAARTYALAKAASITGAILIGGYLATVLVAVGDWAIPAQRERVIAALVATACALVLTAAGLIVERFCQLPPPDENAETSHA